MKSQTFPTTSNTCPSFSIIPKILLEDLRKMIDQTRQAIASTVNASLTMIYWRVGHRIKK